LLIHTFIQAKFSKKYDQVEDAKRFDIFKKKVQEFEAHNEKFKKGEVTWEAGVNQFTDQTEEEAKNRNFGLLNPLPLPPQH
jgi:Cathepsin propeptide inhibitor domain (I29)